MRWLIGFGRFWYDFVVGDSVALAVGGVAVLVVGAVVVRLGSSVLAEVLLPLVVVATLTVSVRRSG